MSRWLAISASVSFWAAARLTVLAGTGGGLTEVDEKKLAAGVAISAMGRAGGAGRAGRAGSRAGVFDCGPGALRNHEVLEFSSGVSSRPSSNTCEASRSSWSHDIV